ncbi:MAG: DUF2946 domain-containing protein [Rhodoferax sp.]|nr:DUF2946 domain-containing protein [Rhodoferax sp.]
MVALQTLRDARSIGRWMLVWFALSIGIAVASPAIKPQTLTQVCTAGGSVEWVTADTGDIAGDDPAAGQPVHGLDCVLCMTLAAPPAADPQPRLLAGTCTAQPVTPSATVVALSIAAPAARGPPRSV